MGQYTLWCLNRVADWDRDRLARALAVKGLWSAKHDVALGSRARFDRHSVWEEDRGTGVLMHEDDACDEYFVPLAVKCIGDPDGFLARLGDRMSAEGRRRFEALRIDFARYFALVDGSGGSGLEGGEPEWRRYWEPFQVNDALWDVGMFTRTDGATPHAGLYEIVATEARDHKRRAILAGYSQGGLVARFLAWMDEQLMDADHRAIAGVVLVQSPNHGSPLADMANADNVSTGLLGILTGLGGIPIIGADDPLTRAAIERLATGRTDAVGDPIWHFGVGAICAVLDAAIKDTPASNPDRYDLLRTARKWMTGLSEEKTFTAFEDLDPAGLDDPRTILGRLATTPLASTFHGAIVGSDTALDDLFFEGKSCLERWLVRLLLAKRWFPPIGDRLCANSDGRSGGKCPARGTAQEDRRALRQRLQGHRGGDRPTRVRARLRHPFGVAGALHPDAPGGGRLLSRQQAEPQGDTRQRRRRARSRFGLAAGPQDAGRPGRAPAVAVTGCRKACGCDNTPGFVVLCLPATTRKTSRRFCSQRVCSGSPAAAERRRRRRSRSCPLPAWDWAGVIGTGQSLSVGVMGTPENATTPRTTISSCRSAR